MQCNKTVVKTSKRNAKWKIKLYDERLNGNIKSGLLFGYSFVSISDSITIIIFLCFSISISPNHFDQLRSTNKLHVIYILIIPYIFYWYRERQHALSFFASVPLSVFFTFTYYSFAPVRFKAGKIDGYIKI